MSRRSVSLLTVAVALLKNPDEKPGFASRQVIHQGSPGDPGLFIRGYSSRAGCSAKPVAVLAILLACPVARGQGYDVVLRGGTVYDRSGRPPVVADVAVRGETIAAVGDLGGAKGRREIDASERDVTSISLPESPSRLPRAVSLRHYVWLVDYVR